MALLGPRQSLVTVFYHYSYVCVECAPFRSNKDDNSGVQWALTIECDGGRVDAVWRQSTVLRALRSTETRTSTCRTLLYCRTQAIYSCEHTCMNILSECSPITSTIYINHISSSSREMELVSASHLRSSFFAPDLPSITLSFPVPARCLMGVSWLMGGWTAARTSGVR